MSQDVSQNLAAASPDFGFLKGCGPALLQAAVAAERNVFEDPVTAPMRLRQFGELLAQEAAATAGLYADSADSQLDLLRRLEDRRVLPREVSDLFHDLRRSGNQVTHEGVATRRDALHQLRVARTLAVWFQRSFGKQPNLKVGKIVPPPDTAEQDNIKDRVIATRRAFLNAKEAKREKAREEARAHKSERSL